MATMKIGLSAAIHAEIDTESTYTLPNSPVILDPISKSYSDYAKLTYYRLELVTMSGINNPVLLQNGKNSRFTASGQGTCTIQLYIEDADGNSDIDTITLNIG